MQFTTEQLVLGGAILVVLLIALFTLFWSFGVDRRLKRMEEQLGRAGVAPAPLTNPLNAGLVLFGPDGQPYAYYVPIVSDGRHTVPNVPAEG